MMLNSINAHWCWLVNINLWIQVLSQTPNKTNVFPPRKIVEFGHLRLIHCKTRDFCLREYCLDVPANICLWSFVSNKNGFMSYWMVYNRFDLRGLVYQWQHVSNFGEFINTRSVCSVITVVRIMFNIDSTISILVWLIINLYLGNTVVLPCLPCLHKICLCYNYSHYGSSTCTTKWMCVAWSLFLEHVALWVLNLPFSDPPLGRWQWIELWLQHQCHN